LQLDLIKGLSEEAKKALAFQLREGIIRGESITKLTERVKEVINDAKWKAERIARTESTRVFTLQPLIDTRKLESKNIASLKLKMRELAEFVCFTTTKFLGLTIHLLLGPHFIQIVGGQ